MADVLAEYRAVFTDAEGERSTNVAYKLVDDAGDVAGEISAKDAWCASLDTVTQAALTECTLTFRKYETLTKPASGAAGSYDDIEDKAFLEFQSADDGAIYKVSVPAPESVSFLADEETVNPAETNMAAFITYVQTNLTTKYGSGSLTYIKGYRTRKKTRRTLRAGISSEIGG